MSPEMQKYILVVDDEADVRNDLQTALEDAGFKVGTAKDGFEAMESVKRNRPDLISLDLVMPKCSGARFYHELRRDKELSKIPVMILTGHAKDDLGRTDFESMIMSGSGLCLEKPVKPDTYVAAVCRMLDIEPPELPADKSENLRNEISKSLLQADPEELKKVLEALKKKGSSPNRMGNGY